MKEKKYKTDKPEWVRGRDMPLFSGKSWTELEDMWPREVRLTNEACLIIGLFSPAWYKTNAFTKSTLGTPIQLRDFFFLCWLHRIEEAKEGLAFHAWAAMKALNIGGRLWYARKAHMTKIGLIENVPVTGYYRTYRITALGKTVIKKFIDSLQEVRDELEANLALHKDIPGVLNEFFQKLENQKPSTY